MTTEFYYNQENASERANELAEECCGIVEISSYDKIYNCTPKDDEAERLLDNGVSGETGAYRVYGEGGYCEAIVAFWE